MVQLQNYNEAAKVTKVERVVKDSPVKQKPKKVMAKMEGKKKTEKEKRLFVEPTTSQKEVEIPDVQKGPMKIDESFKVKDDEGLKEKVVPKELIEHKEGYEKALEEPKESLGYKAQIKDKSVRSPVGVRTSKRSESEKSLPFSWHGSKSLKMVFSLIQDIGDEKSMSFGEFMYFFAILNEIGNNSKGNLSKFSINSLENLNTVSNKVEANQPHFIWAFLNPDRLEVIKKKTLRDILKALNDNRAKGRKQLLDSLEEIIRNSDKDSSEMQK